MHNNAKIPADRRLCMTATARVWEAPEAGEGGRTAQQLVASMDPDSPILGKVAYKLTLSDAIGLAWSRSTRWCVSRYPILRSRRRSCWGWSRGRTTYAGRVWRPCRRAVLKAAAEEKLRKLLTFHHKVSECEAFAEGVPAVASRLRENDPDFYPVPERVWAAWLCGEHSPGYRRQTLGEFSSDVIEYSEKRWEDIPAAAAGAELRSRSERRCRYENSDAVTFCGAGRWSTSCRWSVARRMKPGEGKVASLVVWSHFDVAFEQVYGETIFRFRRVNPQVLGDLRPHGRGQCTFGEFDELRAVVRLFVEASASMACAGVAPPEAGPSSVRCAGYQRA